MRAFHTFYELGKGFGGSEQLLLHVLVDLQRHLQEEEEQVSLHVFSR